MFVSADGISKPGKQAFPSCVLSPSARFHVAWCNYYRGQLKRRRGSLTCLCSCVTAAESHVGTVLDSVSTGFHLKTNQADLKKENKQNLFSRWNLFLLSIKTNYFLAVIYVSIQTVMVPRTSAVCGQTVERIKGRNRSSFIIPGHEISQLLPSKGPKRVTSVVGDDLPLVSVVNVTAGVTANAISSHRCVCVCVSQSETHQHSVGFALMVRVR